jgi:phosphate transport system protein
MAQSLRATFDRELSLVQDDILRLRELVDRAIYRSLECLRERDHQLAQEIVEADEDINRMRYNIEEACLALIATQQPTASDLRAVVAMMSIVVDMERMGDHATGIAKTVIRMGDSPLLKPLVDIPRMVELAREMLRESVDALIHRETVKAISIAARDDEMDQLYRSIFDELVGIMAQQPESVERATYLLWCAHNLERIGDRCTNIAERVIFVRTGSVEDLNA